jgi:hypothetical protein
LCRAAGREALDLALHVVDACVDVASDGPVTASRGLQICVHIAKARVHVCGGERDVPTGRSLDEVARTRAFDQRPYFARRRGSASNKAATRKRREELRAGSVSSLPRGFAGNTRSGTGSKRREAGGNSALHSERTC